MLLNTRKVGALVVTVLLASALPTSLHAETRTVGRGENLQSALNVAVPGDVILLEAGAEFVGNFVLPMKVGDAPIVVRTAPSASLPVQGQRIQPSHAPLLARLRSPNGMSVIKTAAGAHHWELRWLEIAGNEGGNGDILQIGDGSSVQNTLTQVPSHLVLGHLYIHGDRLLGQKRCIALNAAHVAIRDSHIAECKGVGMDTQAIAGWNGPGPFVIENNYLEGAGENVMFGGADPAIPNLVPDGITIRRNHFSRPMSWRDPIIPTPQGLTASARTGGGLAAGTYTYRIIARRPVGQGAIGRSSPSAEASATVSQGGAVSLAWRAVPDATEYHVYGRTAGSQRMYWTVTSTSFTDTGASGTTGSVPTSTGTVWTVKNLFELKNARNVSVEENIFENHWREAQPGWALVFTPRNPSGTCTWCVVEQVRFQYNLVRNVSAGINLIGYDEPARPTRQTNTIVIRQNLFHDMTTGLGGNAWFMQVGDGPRDLTIEHNTIESDGSTVMYTYGGTSTDPREIYGLRMVANAAKHDSYGFSGAFFAYGTPILTNFYPGYVFTANYLAGGSSSRYPAGNFFAGVFEDQFVDAANGNFGLRAGSPLRGAAPDGTDVGVNWDELSRRLAGVIEGASAPFPRPAAPGSVVITR